MKGAFVMGIGFWLYEDIKYDAATGKNLTRGTWEYKVNSCFILNFYLR
jgi:hypothetical protein